MKFILTKITLFICTIGICQEVPKERYLEKYFTDEVKGIVRILIDSENGDTITYISRSGRYLKKSIEGVILIDGHKMGGMGSACGCEPTPHGYWIERYRNDKLKEQGRYFCNRKIGTWIYYHENGKISKVENFAKPYIEMLTSFEYNWDTLLKRYYLLEGPYLEYYPNGQLKVEGTYEIIEEYSKTDTIFRFDLDKYEEKIELVEGDFWIPRSKRSNNWYTYSQNGEVLSHEFYDLKTFEDKNIRPIESRYWEIFEKIFANKKK